MKRWILVAFALVVLAALGVAGGYYLHVKHASRDVKGSSTVEFVPTETTPAVVENPPTLKAETVLVPAGVVTVMLTVPGTTLGGIVVVMELPL